MEGKFLPVAEGGRELVSWDEYDSFGNASAFSWTGACSSSVATSVMFGPAATPVPPTLDCGSCKDGNIDVCVIQQHHWEKEKRLVQDSYGRQALPQLFSQVKFPGPALLSAFHHAMFVLKVPDILLIWVKYKQNCTVCFPCHTIQLLSWEHLIARFLWCGDAVSHGLDITFLMTIFSICLYRCFMAVLWGLFSLLLTAVTVELPYYFFFF